MTIVETADKPLQDEETAPKTLVVPASNPTTMMEVVAPSDLPEGYKFTADFEGSSFVAVVPVGGVKRGQKFMTAMPVGKVVHGTAVHGQWRDGLLDCFSLGFCHPHVCLAWWCRPLALAQVMTRMRLHWMGGPASVSEVPRTFWNVLIFWMCCLVTTDFLEALYRGLTPNHHAYPGLLIFDNPEITVDALVCYHLYKAIEFVFTYYMIVTVWHTRAAVREHYSIPERQACRGCEDCCCSVFCSCCTIAQMMRHTTDYETYPAACCTETGLPAHAPQSVV